MGVTRDLVHYAAKTTFDDLPPQVLDQAKTALLNILAVALGGYQTRIGSLHSNLAKTSAGGIDESTIIGDGSKISCPFAAYTNGNLAFALDYEDVVLYTLHAGPIVVPAALAVGEKVKASGKDVLTAVVLGYEVGTRIGLSMQPSAERGSKVWGQQYTPFAACVSAAKLMNLDEDGMDRAFGVTGTYATVPSAYKYFGIVAETRPMREVKLGWGWMSMAGVFGALSANAGFQGGYGVLDGEEGFWIMAGSDQHDFSKMTEGLGKTYLIMDTEFKVHPSIAWNHPPHTAIKELVKKHTITPDQVEKVVVTGLGAERIADYKPAGEVDAMFSLPYTVATTILGDKLLPEMYSEKRIKSPEVQNLLKRITIRPDPEADRLWFVEHKERFTIDLYLKDKTSIRTQVEYPKDKPHYGKTEVEQKFRDLAAPVLPQDRIAQVIEMVYNLEKTDNISQLLRLLQGK